MRILFATAEVAPVAKTGGLGDVCGSLPKALAKLGHEVVVFMPYYRQAREWFEDHGIVPEVAVPPTQVMWANWSAEATILRTTLPESDVPLYLVVNDHFFDRQQIYALREDGFDDFLLRYVFFCRAIVNACDILGIAPDILHAHDWHTALLPVYLDSGLRGNDSFRTTRSVYTIHNLNYQGIAAAAAFAITGLHSRYWAPDAVEHWGQVNPMKGGILFADQVTTVSPNYAREIQAPVLGAGLDGILRSLSFKLTGVLNGIDVEQWDPATDPLVPSNFTAGRLNGKNLTKRKLLKEAGLRHRAKTPLMAVVSRLVDQKGFQLLTPVVDRLLRLGAQLVVLGSGDAQFEDAFKAVESANPESCRVWIGFDDALAHHIYGGADLLLMPSIYEPCGLNQMYALRYGTLPLVRMTGGLVDTVTPFDGTNADRATGFGFRSTLPHDLFAAGWLAVLNYRETKVWKTLQHNGMSIDFSWDRSAREYDAIYRRAMIS
jgi:starch synthase